MEQSDDLVKYIMHIPRDIHVPVIPQIGKINSFRLFITSLYQNDLI